MTEREFWAACYLAAIKNGKPGWEAKQIADEGVRTYRDL